MQVMATKHDTGGFWLAGLLSLLSLLTVARMTRKQAERCFLAEFQELLEAWCPNRSRNLNAQSGMVSKCSSIVHISLFSLVGRRFLLLPQGGSCETGSGSAVSPRLTSHA